MLVDSHCHLDCLDLEPYQGELEGALARAQESRVGHFLCVSINLQDYPAMLAAVESRADVSVSVGVHPNERAGQEPTLEHLLELAQHPKVVAIGETGLDYFRSEGDLAWQRERFCTHINAAKQCGKPLIIHSREAKEDTLAILQQENAGLVGGVMHCFTEDWDMAQRAMDLGFYISFSGIVTFKSATTLQDVARRIPLDRMLVETDSPYLAPVPHRGKPNEPAYVRHVAEWIAQLRQTTVQEIEQATTDNFYRLFSEAPRTTC